MPRTSVLALRAAPGSPRVLGRVNLHTSFGSLTRLAVVTVHGAWIAVISEALPNNAVAYVRRRQVRLSHDPYAVEVDLSQRIATVWRTGRKVRRFSVAVGSPSTPTPIGRFSTTDKLHDFYPSVYGCCVVALSGHQTHLPSGWTGGDRLAIHGGSGIGTAISNGCLHATEANLVYLMRRVPLGTQVVIHP